VGGLLGSIDETSTVAACFWDTETSGQSTSGGGTGKTTAEMLNITTYTDAEWDFVDETINGDDDIWGINSLHNNGYPYLADNSQEVGNDDPSEQILETTQLIGNYPNPFNPTTTISFNVKQRETATLEIYNIRGQKVKTFAAFKAGKHEVIWNGKDNEGKAVGSGVYFYRLSNGVSNQTRKMLMLK
ncbi:MAG: T9SS type A sorting domain-containing protein, partial [Candidatus Cloacimonetes bacterium]|nr:T9SS type A sorting domain-containing protein [Candidatus Cloacimonadota bacterium]